MNGERDKLRRAFLAKHQLQDAQILPLCPDASFRRYLRLRRNGDTAMLMDAPPPAENAGAFVSVTRHLERLGVRAPAIYASDLDRGFLLLEDLGDRTFSRLLAGGGDETALYRQAVSLLGRIRQHPEVAGIDLPPYDLQTALAEASLLLDWYLPARLQRPVAAGARDTFRRIMEKMLAELPALAPTLVLRDYHVDNLMQVGQAGDSCAVLDYQDALIGSPAYDLASLLEDARRDIAPALRAQMSGLYRAQNSELAWPDLHQHYIVWATQRHCKVAGIFVRLWLRDGKDGYLRHLPRVMNLLQRHLHEAPLEPLRRWFAGHFGELGHTPFKAAPARLLRHCKAT